MSRRRRRKGGGGGGQHTGTSTQLLVLLVVVLLVVVVPHHSTNQLGRPSPLKCGVPERPRQLLQPLRRRKNSPAHGLLTPTCSYRLPTDLPTLLQLPHHSTNQLGAPLPTEVPPRCAQVRCLHRLHRRKNSPLGAPTDATEYPPPSQSPSNPHTPAPNQLGACSLLLKCPPDASKCRSCC